jgi:hypothetical protein
MLLEAGVLERLFSIQATRSLRGRMLSLWGQVGRCLALEEWVTAAGPAALGRFSPLLVVAAADIWGLLME